MGTIQMTTRSHLRAAGLGRFQRNRFGIHAVPGLSGLNRWGDASCGLIPFGNQKTGMRHALRAGQPS